LYATASPTTNNATPAAIAVNGFNAIAKLTAEIDTATAAIAAAVTAADKANKKAIAEGKGVAKKEAPVEKKEDLNTKEKIEAARTRELEKVATDIFPNTKIKNILHHWSVGSQISDSFGDDLGRVKGVWLSDDPSQWKEIVSNKAKRLGGSEIKGHSVIINSEKVWVSSTLSGTASNTFPVGYDTIAAYNEAPNNYSGEKKTEFKIGATLFNVSPKSLRPVALFIYSAIAL